MFAMFIYHLGAWTFAIGVTWLLWQAVKFLEKEGKK